MIKHAPGVHWEPSRSAAAEDYCTKDATAEKGPWSFGIKPIARQSRADWNRVRDMAKKGKIEDLPADIYIKSYSTLKRIAEDHAEIPETLPQCRGIFIQGPSGVGKTSYWRSLIPTSELYLKGRNKWWDGYNG